mmetsp:Transcript_28910/g.76279  ORF Transcript_28910/g.76279 Transcript_28910/m.76279 type:complete len:243 (-) Transcript_28910:154-882(-)
MGSRRLTPALANCSACHTFTNGAPTPMECCDIMMASRMGSQRSSCTSGDNACRSSVDNFRQLPSEIDWSTRASMSLNLSFVAVTSKLASHGFSSASATKFTIMFEAPRILRVCVADNTRNVMSWSATSTRNSSRSSRRAAASGEASASSTRPPGNLYSPGYRITCKASAESVFRKFTTCAWPSNTSRRPDMGMAPPCASRTCIPNWPWVPAASTARSSRRMGAKEPTAEFEALRRHTTVAAN